MAPSENTVDTVAFVCKPDIGDTYLPCGTAFLVSVLGENRMQSLYFVTAKHVVKDEPITRLRLRRHDGGPPDDIPVREWVEHDHADIAITRFELDRRSHRNVPIAESAFADRWSQSYGTRLHLGDSVAFVGLLANLESMHERAIPMLRAGVIGAFYQRDVPVRDEILGSAYDEPCAHLIDCHSVGGFSGSPVFVEQPALRQKDHSLSVSGVNGLFGVLVGHFVGTAGGIGIVVPVEAVRELLDLEKVVMERKQHEAEVERIIKERREKNAGVQDSAPTADPEDEYQRFEDLTRQLVNTPKPKDQSDPLKY